ncbi:MAG: hypothetical protein QMC36_05450 [Patescibacteria group bacterium]
MAHENSPSNGQDNGRLFNLEEAIVHLKGQGKLSADYTVRQYRDSTVVWGFAGHVLAKFFQPVGTDRFALKTSAA